MINNHEQMSLYFQNLFIIKSKMEGLSHAEQDIIWSEEYHKIKSPSGIVVDLPFYLALIHPDFYFCNGRYIGENLSWKRNNMFSSGITNIDRCQYVKFTGVECIFNSMPSIRGKCHADHIWPNSLGGPTILDNRLLLCKYHNSMKGNNISEYFWNDLPTWVMDYLNKLARLKI